MRRRLLWSLLASAIINVVLWLTLPAGVAVWRESREPRETLKVSWVFHARRPRPRGHLTAAPVPQAANLGPPPPATLALPHGWTRQDFAFLGTTQTAEWLDWNNQSARWVPRVFLWQVKQDPEYMQRPTLRSAIRKILDSLRQDAKLHASRAERVCSGTRGGWFLSYTKPDDDPPLRFEETLFMAGDKLFRAIYIRAANQPEDLRMRKALSTLCWP